MTCDDEAGLGRREQKKRETRQAIRDAALDLAIHNGVEGLTVEAIARKAGVSPRTFFNYFESKEDALVTQAAERSAQVRYLLLKRPAEEAPMRAFYKALLASDYFSVDPKDRARVRARQRLTQENPALMTHHLGKIAMVERDFAAALAERMGVDPSEDISPELLAAMAMSAIRVALRHWVVDDPEPLHEVLDTIFERLEHIDHFTAHLASVE